MRARGFPVPASGQPASDVDMLFPGRYAGLAMSSRVRTLAGGASWRANDWLAIGAGVSASRVSLDETRRIWAGFAGRDTLGDASRDVTVRVSGDDAIVPGAAAGLLIAPVDTPVELGASIAWSARASIAGDVSATAASPTAGPEVRGSGRAETTMAQPLVIRTGARWLADRWIAEIGGALWLYPQDAAIDWRLGGVTIVDDVTQKMAPLSAMSSQLVRRGHGAVRASLDVQVVPGLVWVNGAWSWASAATPTDRLSPAAGDLGGHTFAFGADLSAGSFTISLGLSRTFAPATDVRVTRLVLDNPFAAGTQATGLGTHDEARDVIAITLEAEK
jgi:hypothetical protein